MKFFAAIFICFSFLFVLGQKTLVTAKFYSQKSKIEKALCEMRDNPENSCKGSCVLKFRLQQQKNSMPDVPPVSEILELTVFASGESPKIKAPVFENTIVNQFENLVFNYEEPWVSISLPPPELIG